MYVRRAKYAIENSWKFKIMESRFVSRALYSLAMASRKTNGQSVVIFYEKFAAKTEEGVYEVFERSLAENRRSYFVLDSESSDYRRLSGSPNVLAKFSWKYYWQLYRANLFVGTEVPTHLSLLRSNNSWLRRKIYSTPYVFLQHGIIFMKNLGRTSVYVKDREGEPSFIVASSRKEREVIERDLQIPRSRVLLTGLAQFASVERGSVDASMPDVVSVMLTWKPWDEANPDFSSTTYVEVLEQIVRVIRERSSAVEIRVLPHPKVAEQLAGTHLAPLLWTDPLSSALGDTKLLITDYSSICYNSFYRGSAVLFYQPDLEQYEKVMGALIPRADEYIGHRCLTREELSSALHRGIDERSGIHLGSFRLARHERVYGTINEYSDEESIERIVEALRSVEKL